MFYYADLQCMSLKEKYKYKYKKNLNYHFPNETPTLEMGHVPTWAYFWPAVNKRLTSLWPRYFLIQPEEILFDRREKNWKIWHLQGKFVQYLK